MEAVTFFSMQLLLMSMSNGPSSLDFETIHNISMKACFSVCVFDSVGKAIFIERSKDQSTQNVSAIVLVEFLDGTLFFKIPAYQM